MDSILVADPSAGLAKAQAMIKPLMRLIGRSLETIAQRRSELIGHGERSPEADGERSTPGDVRMDAGRYGKRMQEEMWWLERRISQGEQGEKLGKRETADGLRRTTALRESTTAGSS